MSFVTAALIGAGAAVVGGAISSRAARKAADTQSNATTEASRLQSDAGIRAAEIQREIANATIAEQRRQYNRTEQLQKPWYTAGKNALNQLVPLASNYTPFGMEQFEADPGYSFRMDEGMKALERSAAARGGLLSGSAMKGIQRFGQGLASEEYTNAFNRYQTERAAQLNPLQSLAGMGQTTAQQIGQAGQTMASNIGQTNQAMGTNLGNIYTSTANNLANNAMSAANARASGYVGQANALNTALNTGLNFYQDQQLFNLLKPRGGSSMMSEPYPGYNASVGLG
jgi:hypothetical protein